MVGEAGNALAIASDLLAVAVEADDELGRVLLLVFKVAGDGGLALPLGDEQTGVGGAEGTERGDETDGLEEVGFPLTIGTQKKLLPTRERKLRQRDVADVLKGEAAETHGGRRRPGCDRRAAQRTCSVLPS